MCVYLYTCTCSVTDLQNRGIFNIHKNKGKVFIHITSVEEVSGTRQLISHSSFQSSISTKNLLFSFFTAGIILHQTICR